MEETEFDILLKQAYDYVLKENREEFRIAHVASVMALFAESQLTALQSRITELERQVSDLTAERDYYASPNNWQVDEYSMTVELIKPYQSPIEAYESIK